MLLLFHVKSVISDLQHGFVQGRLTDTNLTTTTEFVASALDRNEQAVYTDLTFDRMGHGIVL